MMISTRGRYALTVMIYLSDHADGRFIPLKEIAEKEDISEKYLENIISALSKENYLEGLRGKGGGYRLTRTPSDYSVGEILQFIIASYHGIQTGYVLANCYDAEQLRGQYDPGQMFSCLADVR